MSSPSPVPNGQSTTILSWSRIAPYVTPPVSAACATIATFRRFQIKSAKQAEKPSPSITFTEGLRGGFKAMPVMAAGVGFSIIIQTKIENGIKHIQKNFKNENIVETQPHSANFYLMLTSSLIVGAASSPFWAAFNRLTLSEPFFKSFRKLSFKQIALISGRESTFLFSVRISDPVSDIMKGHLGDHVIVKCGSAFVTGMIGAVFNHPLDTLLTRDQKNLKTKFAQLFTLGLPQRALTVGYYALIYKIMTEILRPKKEC